MLPSHLILVLPSSLFFQLPRFCTVQCYDSLNGELESMGRKIFVCSEVLRSTQETFSLVDYEAEC
jgi:hypothetical protein